nr:PREDICTED: uncharacterized protein LOC109041941 isoform X1 [Bemisia tabaci]
MDVTETMKEAGSENDTVRKSERKPVKKKFDDFEIDVRKKARLENDEGNDSSMIEYQNVDKEQEISSENQFDIDPTQNESIVFTIEERIGESNILEKLKTLESSESDNNNHCSEPRRLTVKELLEIVEPKMSVSEFQNLVQSKSLNDSPVKKPPSTKRFRNEWLKMSEFKEWLQPHSLRDKAFCTICNKVLNAGKSELEKHGATRKHYTLLEQWRSSSNDFLERPRSSITGSPVSNSMFNAAPFRRKHSSESSNDGGPAIQVPDSRPQLEIVIPSGDEETEEYDYELEENDGKRYSNHSFAQPVKHKEKDNSSQSKAAAVSKAAPFWKASAIVNGHVTELKLSDYKGRYIVLIFYPQDFSRVCQSELLAISDRISEFRALNAEVVACSVDSFLAHQVWCRTPRSEGGLANPKIALLSDPTHSISKDYGCFMPELGHTLRAYYIIDHRGIIRQITINDISVGRSTDELLRLVEAFQQTDETEASAPADWKSGQPLYS